MKDIRTQWKALAAEKKITSSDIAALCIYRSLLKDEGRDGAIGRLKKSFKPITNQVKLDNGAYPYGAIAIALYGLKRSAFLSWLDDEDKEKILEISKTISGYKKVLE